MCSFVRRVGSLPLPLGVALRRPVSGVVLRALRRFVLAAALPFPHPWLGGRHAPGAGVENCRADVDLPDDQLLALFLDMSSLDVGQEGFAFDLLLLGRHV